MPKSNLIGGKNHKRLKKKRGIVEPENKQVQEKVKNQVYAQVLKKCGGTRLLVMCSDAKERSAIIPGKFYKKVWIVQGDIILCDLNIGGCDDQCYVVHKYSNNDVRTLMLQNKINFEVDKSLIEFSEVTKSDDKYDDERKLVPSISTSESDDDDVIDHTDHKRKKNNYADTDSDSGSIDITTL